MTKLSPKAIRKQLKMAMKGSNPSTDANEKREEPADVPVFMLPHNDLSPIPEDGEVYQGFFVRMSLKPHQQRRYSGLMSLSNLDREAIEKSATMELEFRSYCKPAKAPQMNQMGNKMARHMVMNHGHRITNE